jgi:protein-S-isoprenylcysteine O-methyltransferase Ste14
VLYVRAVVALVLPLAVDVAAPAWLLQAPGARFDIGPLRFIGLLPVAFGAWLLFDSVFLRFAREGRGTLAPLDPPRFVVRGGPYRFVRNPMYVANVGIVTGSAVLFQSWWLLIWAGAILVMFHAFAVFYEEPTLHRLFGEEYDTYRRGVGRWIPRRPPN